VHEATILDSPQGLEEFLTACSFRERGLGSHDAFEVVDHFDYCRSAGTTSGHLGLLEGSGVSYSTQAAESDRY
jgi:hypothetical protein